jgi:glycogen debranching enzyme
MDVLADLAERLNRPPEAVVWSARADALLSAMVGRLWDSQRFTVRRVDDGLINPTSRSALVFMPLVLGRRLPPSVREAMIAELRHPGGQLGPHGLMSEHPESPHYVPDGYWRGPVWSPPTLLVSTGLAELGEMELARAVASRWAACCARHGFAENFNALTGAPQRDRAMPWASAVWLLLAEAGLAVPGYS